MPTTHILDWLDHCERTLGEAERLAERLARHASAAPAEVAALSAQVAALRRQVAEVRGSLPGPPAPRSTDPKWTHRTRRPTPWCPPGRD